MLSLREGYHAWCLKSRCYRSPQACLQIPVTHEAPLTLPDYAPCKTVVPGGSTFGRSPRSISLASLGAPGEARTRFCLGTATISGRNGANRLEQMQPQASYISRRAAFTSGVVDPRPSSAVEVLRLSFVSKEPDGGLAEVTGEGHEFVQNQSFLLVAGLKVSGSPGFHKLGYPGLGHRFLLLSVTRFMRNRQPLR